MNKGALCLIFLLIVQIATSWVLPVSRSAVPVSQRKTTCRLSTPFEADFYDNPYDKDNASLEFGPSSLAVSPDTKIILGLNKYSHDASVCAADAATGKVLFALAKERITRKKTDSGNTASLIETCLDALDLDLDNIEKVVVNNHHHRVLPMEANLRHMEWESGLEINGGAESGYEEPENTLSDMQQPHHEISHHLAHAYSTATQSPFDSGMVVVMDGMGETYRTMMHAEYTNDTSYTSDFSFDADSFTLVPANLKEQAAMSYYDWREAESVYVFEKHATTMDLYPVFKRFTPENSPPALYNHGFENMDSVGAVYSRASSHIFGDWNACGKVMGLAPWARHAWQATGSDGSDNIVQPQLLPNPILAGKLYHSDDADTNSDPLQIDRTYLEGMPLIARNDPDLFSADGKRKKRYDFDDDEGEGDAKSKNTEDEGAVADKRIPVKVATEAIALAYRMQIDLENVVMDFCSHFQKETGQVNLCLAGGVALNSVLNGRLARELGFEKTFVSPYPGDDGIAVGCCAFGLFGNKQLDENKGIQQERPPVWNGPLSPYLGPCPSEYEIKMAIEEAAPWLEVEAFRNEDQRLKTMVEEVESGGIVAWYHSRSELGPRALGHRSILADPRKKVLVRFINEKVKSRESFRPFAPSVLAEEATNWFDLGENVGDANISPFMSMTAMVHEDKRARIPAVTHVDGSSRLQTVTKEDEPLYHKFISKFFELTGVPMVLNTSFNTLPSEPIVESPSDAIRSFLYSMDSIEMLVMGDYVIKRKLPNLRKLLGESNKEGNVQIEPGYPKRAGATQFQSSFEVEAGPIDEEAVQTITKVRMPDRPMHSEKDEWYELLDDLEGELLSVCDGTTTLNEIMAQYTSTPEGQSLEQKDVDEAQSLLQNIVHRLVRLYEHTLISW
jgi:predicted NodU family carbamoyl transferase